MVVHTHICTTGVESRRVAQGQPWVCSLRPLWAIGPYLKKLRGKLREGDRRWELGRYFSTSLQDMSRLPSELWQEQTPFLLVWHLVYFCSYQKAKGIKLKCTHYRTRLRGKIRTSPSSHEQDTSTVHMPMCRAVRQGLQLGRVAPSGKAPLHCCQQDRLLLSVLSTCHCSASWPSCANTSQGRIRALC